MSDTDSFIEEVTEEVRRERLFGYMRKYGWIAVALVLLIVGGAAWNEVEKSRARSAAEASGDAIFRAVQANDIPARVAALQSLETESPEAQMVADFLLAANQADAGDRSGAAATLEGLVNAADSDMPEIYRQIALFKSVALSGADRSADERRALLEPLAVPGAPLALLAQEQLALIDIETGETGAAIDRLNAISQDSAVSAGLRRRATQLIVALGGTPEAIAGQTASQ
ncbi:tetratricopeptide repeat protein [Shimia sp.]|uniref:tetratricopeptide repeat protein n=1 Tax=Shimia sp. TaxID=1954381 RepID=UPI00356A9DAA